MAVSNFDMDWRQIMENIFWRYFWMCSERRTVLSSMQRDFLAKLRTKCGRPASSHQQLVVNYTIGGAHNLNYTDQPSSRCVLDLV